MSFLDYFIIVKTSFRKLKLGFRDILFSNTGPKVFLFSNFWNISWVKFIYFTYFVCSNSK